MCSISGSQKLETVKELAALNAYRGQLSHSITVFTLDFSAILYEYKAVGVLNIEDHILPDGYILIHQQAPTTENDGRYIHPAQVGNNRLWHNGIIKAKCIQELNKEYTTNIEWDTQLLLTALQRESWLALNKFDGTFACVYWNGSNLFLFRNQISPLFVSDNGDISSTRLNGFYSLPPDQISNLICKFETPAQNCILTYNIAQFKTYDNPYYFPN